MDRHIIPVQLAVIGLLALTAVALHVGVDVTLVDQPGVMMSMPQQAGEWTGAQIRYCHATDCGWTGPATDAHDHNTCPRCGESLFTMARVEKEQLPADTQFVKYRYRNAAGHTLVAAIVLSGNERNSIHRPQRCLVAQGLEILDTRYLPLELTGRDPVITAVLDTVYHTRDGRHIPAGYAYWFVGQQRETPRHLTRMFWMAWDRIVHGRAHRWAYVLVQGELGLEGDAFTRHLESFVPHWYPALLRETTQ